MKKERGFSMIVLLLLFVFSVLVWGGNAYKLSECDFEADYRCEIIHGAGLLMPPLSTVTVWFNTDNS